MEVENGRSIRSVADEYNIDRMTLTRYLSRHTTGCDTAAVGYNAVALSHQVLSQGMEIDLANHVKELANQFHGLSPEKFRQLSYEYAVKNNIVVPANWTRDGKAGK